MGKTLKTVQLSLFDDITSNNSTTYNEVEIEKTLNELKKFIKSGVINESDTYFNISTEREPIIKEDNEVYGLHFAQSSDSERLLTLYEHNPKIKPTELLGAGVASAALKSIKCYIDENPTATTKEVLEHFSIFNYPTYRWTHAQSKSLEELEIVKNLIIRWAKLKNRLLFDLSEGRFTFMRINKRNKEKDQTKIVPQCFDGMCLEQNFLKLIKELSWVMEKYFKLKTKAI